MAEKVWIWALGLAALGGGALMLAASQRREEEELLPGPAQLVPMDRRGPSRPETSSSPINIDVPEDPLEQQRKPSANAPTEQVNLPNNVPVAVKLVLFENRGDRTRLESVTADFRRPNEDMKLLTATRKPGESIANFGKRVGNLLLEEVGPDSYPYLVGAEDPFNVGDRFLKVVRSRLKLGTSGEKRTAHAIDVRVEEHLDGGFLVRTRRAQPWRPLDWPRVAEYRPNRETPSELAVRIAERESAAPFVGGGYAYLRSLEYHAGVPESWAGEFRQALEGALAQIAQERGFAYRGMS